MIRSGLLSLLLFFSTCLLTGRTSADSASNTGKLDLRLRNINFIKNNEYSNPIIEGYTLIGYFLQPELIYHPSEKVRLQLGAHLLQYSGTNKFNLVKPVFSTTYIFSENLFFTMGSLPGTDEHRMFDPHFNKEKLYNSYSQDGFELSFRNDNFFNDTWLAWEHFIFKGDFDREIFTAGESFSYTSDQINGLFRINVPLQIQFKHFGGQISNYPEHVETFFNLAAGAGMTFEIPGSKYQEAGFQWLLFYGRSLTENAQSHINKGHGEWYKIFYNYRYTQLEAGFWSSHDFYAPNGNFIFSSVSDFRNNLIIHDRKLITLSANLKLMHNSFLEFYAGFDGYYDIDLNRFDNAATLHLRLDKLIRLAELKNHRK